jgi:hypothetical protein
MTGLERLNNRLVQLAPRKGFTPRIDLDPV